MKRIGRAGLALMALAAAVAPAGPAAAAGKRWTRITARNFSPLEQVGLARTDDRVLKVAWVHPGPGGSYDLVVTPVRRDGRAGAPAVVARGWTTLSSPALVRTGARSLALLWSGIRSTAVGEPFTGLNAATSADGTAWSLVPQSLSLGGSGPVSAVLGPPPAGTVVSAWSRGGENSVFSGLAPSSAVPPHFAAPQCCYTNVSLAVDGRSGELVAATDSIAATQPGRSLVRLTAAGAAAGPAVHPPGAYVRTGPGAFGSITGTGRPAIAGRPRRPGIFTAYISGKFGRTRLLVWRLGAPRPAVLGSTALGYVPDSIGLAVAPSGRIWAFWAEKAATPSGYVVVARRSNRAATRFGPRLAIAPPPGTVNLTEAAGNAQTGPLDLLLTSQHSNVDTAAWHRQFITGVSLFPTPRAAKPGQKVTFLVTDAGDPVRRARVRFGTRSGRTNAKGQVTLRAPAATTIATVTASGYGAARARVTIR